MMIFKKAIPRRAFLRVLGASIALPLLDDDFFETCPGFVR